MFYYKCEKCQSEWNGIKTLECCPFCNTKTVIKISNFTKIDDALSYLFGVFGIEVIKENNRLVALLSDYAPTLERERKLIRVALNLGIYSELATINRNDKFAQDLSVKKAIAKLHDDAFMDPVIAKEIISWFVAQLNWEEKMLQQESKSVIEETKFATRMPNQKVSVNSTNNMYNVGDIVEFGKYPFEANGKVKPVTWRIMDIKDNNALLWSEYCVDSGQFAGQNLNSSWEYSSLRRWIREKFMRDAFTTEEISFIVFTDVNTTYNPVSKQDSGPKTTDKIFIPSNEDLNYFKLKDKELIVKASPYAIKKGVFNIKGNAFWWLRTPGTEKATQMLVSLTGARNEAGSNVYLKNRGVRLALWVDLNKLK